MKKLGDLIMILDLHRQGLKVAVIARQVGIDRKTVRKYIAQGIEVPTYGPRQPRERLLDPWMDYLRSRLDAYPGLSARRLLREICERGYTGGYSTVRDTVRALRPAGGGSPFAVRFETPPGQQAQVDFAQFRVRFTSAPDSVQIVWLFSMVLGFSRLIWARFAQRQTMQTVLACHRAAFETIGGVPREILYDRMKTAVLGEDEDGRVVYNRTLGEFAHHYGFLPKACRAYRPETKGKVERPFRYIREDFFLGGTFRDLDDLNLQFVNWLGNVANPRVHASTGRVVNEAFAQEQPTLQLLPLIPFGAVLKLERRISHEGMVSVGGNYYSVPDATRRRVVEVHSLADEIHIFEDNRLIARHPLLEGRRQRSLLEGHRRQYRPKEENPVPHGFTGELVTRRSLDFYAAIGQQLAASGARV
ncbi:MAG: IS21 family transposase [Sphingopyxis sp.]|uniref:IS21 family transposase n=1 Tax=Bosea sp. (in: a-proteobacteria) TaxID=1871050 RepID=UPI00121E858E|nr:IS21 family transposase [Bosea sp. (in: a-proteobacteria)]MBJ7442691.1 IS21 family transposase [Sphingopyxis sp.]TAJ28129.1 MAG: IS21 family transposase [Bosea sp. (in: a-proteobacteria)]